MLATAIIGSMVGVKKYNRASCSRATADAPAASRHGRRNRRHDGARGIPGVVDERGPEHQVVKRGTVLWVRPTEARLASGLGVLCRLCSQRPAPE